MVVNNNRQLVGTDPIGPVDHEVSEVFSASEFVVSEVIVGEGHDPTVGNLEPPIESRWRGQLLRPFLGRGSEMNGEDGFLVVVEVRG